MPPARLVTSVNPRWMRKVAAFAERTTWWQWMSSGAAGSVSFSRAMAGHCERGRSSAPGMRASAPFVGLAHVDEPRRQRGGDAGVRLDGGDFGDHEGGQGEIVTGVPTPTFSKNRSDVKPGMRMQP